MSLRKFFRCGEETLMLKLFNKVMHSILCKFSTLRTVVLHLAIRPMKSDLFNNDLGDTWSIHRRCEIENNVEASS